MADVNGTTAGSADAAAAGQPVVKTEKQLKKEAKKNAKLAKFNEKLAQQKVQTTEEVIAGRTVPNRFTGMTQYAPTVYTFALRTELEGEREEASC